MEFPGTSLWGIDAHTRQEQLPRRTSVTGRVVGRGEASAVTSEQLPGRSKRPSGQGGTSQAEEMPRAGPGEEA